MVSGYTVQGVIHADKIVQRWQFLIQNDDDSNYLMQRIKLNMNWNWMDKIAII